MSQEFFSGQEWQRKKQPVEVNTHDFPDPKLGKVVPYGVYDLAANLGWVNVGINHDYSEFAVSSIRQWWQHMGKQMYPDADQLLITADCGGSNGYRLRFCQTQRPNLANESGLRIQVAHFPPGTTSRTRREFAYLLSLLQGEALVSPLEGFSHGAVEVIDKFKDTGLQLSFADEIGSS